MTRDLKVKLHKKGGFLGTLLTSLAGPLIGSLLRGGKGMKKTKGGKKTKSGKKSKGGAVKLIGGGAVVGIGSRGGAVKLIGANPRKGGNFSKLLSTGIKLGADFLKRKIQSKVQEKVAQYKADPMSAVNDAKKAYSTGKQVYSEVKAKSGGKMRKLKTIKYKGATRRRALPAGVPATNTQATTGITLTRKLYKEPTNLSINEVKKRV